MVATDRTRVDQQVAAALGGDRAALDRVVADWLPTVYGWCTSLGAGRIDAEEAAHDVLMTLVRRHRTIQVPRQLPRWLFSASQRIVANHRRRAWLRRWLPGVDLDTHVAPGGADERTEQQALANRIDAALEVLSMQHREVIVLCCIEERPLAEAADLLGVPEGTVKSRLFNARTRFRAAYDRQEP